MFCGIIRESAIILEMIFVIGFDYVVLQPLFTEWYNQ